MNLDQSRLESALAAEWPGQFTLDLFATLESTNRHLAVNLAGGNTASGEPQCRVCVTDQQTAGVGRQGRTWHSPQNSITFSLQRRFELPAARLMGLSLVTGIAVADVLSANIPDSIELKWPNDVLVAGRKLAGILIELPLSDSSSSTVITGIGINFANGPEHRNVDQPYATLESASPDPLPDKSSLIGTLAGRVLAEYDAFAESGWSAFAERWQQRDYLAGKPVQLSTGGESAYGIARGIAADGGLLVDQEGQQKTYYSGEVSVRLTK